MQDEKLISVHEVNRWDVCTRIEKWLRSDGTIVEYFFCDGHLVETKEVK